MRTTACVATALGLTMLASATAEPATIKIAAWNLNNLHFVVDEPLRDRAPPGPKRITSSSASTATASAPRSSRCRR